MNIISWLEGVEPRVSTDARAQRLPKTRKRKQQQVPTPSSSILDTIPDPSVLLLPNKRRRFDQNSTEDEPDVDRTPRGRGRTNAWSASERTGSPSSGTSRVSPTKRLAMLEIANNPVVVAQINMTDPRMPAELKTVLEILDRFQERVGIVPAYLKSEIEIRAKWDGNLYNFRPTTFRNTAADNTTTDIATTDTATTDNATTDTATTGNSGTDITAAPDLRLSLDRVIEVFSEANQCFNAGHTEATWNTLVHWPVFQLALGAMSDNPKIDPEVQEHQIRVHAMPCTTARLKGNPRGSKLVDYCIFVEPQNEDLVKVDELRTQLDCSINHTDYFPLRQWPVVLSAESKKPGEGFKEAQVQLGVWQAAQWALLESLVDIERDATQPLIPFLPALIIQGHEWSFVATTKSGKQTVLWLGQAIGKTDSVLGVFQIIHALRHIAAWIRGTYWPWYQKSILQLGQ